MFKLLSRLRPARLISAAALGLALHAAPAAAAVYNLGDLALSVPYASSLTRTGSFSDIFNFSLSAPSELAGSLVSLDLVIGTLPYFHIDSPSVSLFSVGNPATAIVNGLNNSFTAAGLASGDYFLRVSGNADGLAGGHYLFGLVAQPVPEPEQWMLMVAGLLAFAAVAHRRIS